MQKQEIEEYNKLCAIFIGWTVGNFINKYPKVSYTLIRREILVLERQGYDVQRITFLTGGRRCR